MERFRTRVVRTTAAAGLTGIVLTACGEANGNGIEACPPRWAATTNEVSDITAAHRDMQGAVAILINQLREPAFGVTNNDRLGKYRVPAEVSSAVEVIFLKIRQGL